MGGMGKGSGVWLGEKGESAGPNKPADGDSHWKGGGKAGDAGQWEVG